MAARLAIDHLSVVLGGRRVVETVSVAIEPGEVLAVLGPNGAGKSTLLRAAAGLITPEAGRVTLDGDDVAGLERRTLGRRIAFLPQERTVHWPVTVRTLVGLGRLPHRRSPAAGESDADRAAIARAMAATDVGSLAERNAQALSGGERARVLIARTLAQEAPILIADEPTAGLDPAHQLAVLDLLARHARDGGSVLIALHDLSAALRHATRVLVLKDGRTLALGSPREVLTPEHLATCYGIRAQIRDIDGVPIVLALAPLA
jgi:iron complex transport system ATP-binding protein